MELSDQITIIISTLNERIESVDRIIKFEHPSVKYLIVHQNNKCTKLPNFLFRKDIKVIVSPSTGLSKSRNIGIKNCTTKYALIADDDIEYIEDGILKLLDIIKSDSPDLAVFKIKTLENECEYKLYLEKKTIIDSNYKQFISSVEILININRLKENKILFDERFGLGTKLIGGEESILLYDCLKSNFFCVYYPIYLLIHPYESSGKKKYSDFKIFFKKGALNQRRKEKIMHLKYFIRKNLFKMPLNIFYYFMGRIYIILTNK